MTVAPNMVDGPGASGTGNLIFNLGSSSGKGTGVGKGDKLLNPQNRRAKVVAFTGKELFSLFKSKLFGVGLWAAALRKEKERKERERKEELAKKRAAEAKKNGLPPLPAGPPPVPSKGPLKVQKKIAK